MSATISRLAETKTMLAEMVAEARELQASAGGSVTDAVAGWLAGQYAAAAYEKLSEAQGRQHWEILRALVQDWTLLRRGDQQSARLQLDREELEWQRSNSKAQKEKEFREWIQRPEIRAQFLPDLKHGFSQETLRKIETELGLL